MNDEMPRRARTVAEYRELWRRVGEVSDVAGAIRSHRPRATDVIISPFAKCGTTWLQQIFHTLRSGGDSDFDETSGRDYWSHLTSWWDQRGRDDVLLLSYESMIKDPEQSIRRVADLCGLAVNDDLLATTLERSSFAFMLEHQDKFDERLTREATERWRILPPGGESSKVRTGGIGGHRQELSPQVAAAMDAVWKRRITPHLGFSDYAALEAAIG